MFCTCTFSYLIEKNENVLPSVRILLQHMCMKVPDKAEYRSKVAQVGRKKLMKCNQSDYNNSGEFVMSKNWGFFPFITSA